MKKFDVVGFGALNVDKLYRVDKIACRDEESFITGYSEACGGSAANTIVGLARLGLKTGYIGKISRDKEGEMLLREFIREGVDTSGILVTSDGHSGIVMGFVDKNGERALYVNPGVNDEISFEEIDINYAKSSKILHLTSFIGEKPFKAQIKLIEAISNDIQMSFDPGILYARKGLKKLKPFIERSSILLLSGAQLKALTGKNYRDGAKLLLKQGANIAAIKLGMKGCYVTDGKEEYFIKPFQVKVIDTTGAGDAFNAGFLYGLIKQKDIYECGRLGNFVASRCIQKIGARAGLPTISDLTSSTP